MTREELQVKILELQTSCDHSGKMLSLKMQMFATAHQEGQLQDAERLREELHSILDGELDALGSLCLLIKQLVS